ncbi:hypothetical protein QZN01_29505 [Burkholderia cenocepacia]|uniref:hypothetical protein n=1 Tax=Burkholderia cenocepacia TaxID=95486 RepID=UPI00130D6447|nr:hypothetical protein [Burkholderia cenocepacia]MDN7826815.1 hypothetical protein [Burkholderia cenocepacia]HEM8999230.1 hypothetical protein [Burkholderia cenocepacia]
MWGRQSGIATAIGNHALYATIASMSEHGIERMRGGLFCQSDQAKMEVGLRATGAWDRIKQARASRAAWSVDASWILAAERLASKFGLVFAGGLET